MKYDKVVINMVFLENLTLSNCTIGARNVLTESDKKVKYFPRISSLFVSSNISHSQVTELDLQ